MPMTNRLSLLAACGLACLAFAATPARADDDCRGPVSRAQAIEIARSVGMVQVREVDCDDDDEWEVEGRDARGREMEVEISSRTGRVLEIEYDD